MEVIEYGVVEIQEAVSQVNEIGIDEILNLIEELMLTINDIREIAVLIFGFLVGYVVVRDFLNNILKSV